MPARPTLTRAHLLSRGTPPEVVAPTASQLDAPERVIQFGTGAFLRGFAEYFVDESNRRGEFGGRVVMVGSTGSGRDARLNEQDGLYTLVMQGRVDGEARREVRIVGAVSRALSATSDWDAVLRCAESETMSLVVSNTTEVGIALDEADAAAGPAQAPPRSFPGKLTGWLLHRARHFAFDPARAPIVLPCELIEDNGTMLGSVVRELARRWALEPEFLQWLDAVTFCNTLVDRIVQGAPTAAQRAELEEMLGYDDAMMTACEPYRLLAVEGDDALRVRLRLGGTDDGIIVTGHLAPYRERKVRILNGAHTVLVPLALLAGCATVREAVEHPVLGAFLRAALFDEIVPNIDVPLADAFAKAVLDRFANPWLDHQLWDITLQGAAKVRVRVVPTIVDYARRHDEVPRGLALGVAGYLVLQRGDLQRVRSAAGLAVPPDDAGAAVRDAWRGVADDAAGVTRFVAGVLGERALWGTDLTAIPGFGDLVTRYVLQIRRDGALATVGSMLEVTA